MCGPHITAISCTLLLKNYYYNQFISLRFYFFTIDFLLLVFLDLKSLYWSDLCTTMILWNDQDFHLLFYSIRLCFFFAPQTFCFVQEILILCSLQAVDIGLEDNSDEQLNTRLLPG